jgi:hypothetical protein
MSITNADIDSFCSFAKSQIAVHNPESMGELFELFLLEHPSSEEQAEVRAAIERGLADVEAGRVRPADEVMAELREQYGWKQV